MDIQEIIEKIEAGDMEDAKNMVEQYSESINAIHSDNKTYLMAASELGNIDLMELLINAGADLDMCNKNQQTALHYAVLGCQLQAVTILISLGSDVNKTDNQSRTPLHCAVNNMKECKDMVAALLQTKGKNAIKVNQRDFNYCTPLHHACSLGYRDIIYLLLNHSQINVNEKCCRDDTPLHCAIKNQHYDVVNLLLSQESIQLETRGDCRRTPLLEAVNVGHLGIVHMLIARGAKVNALNSRNENCLFSALQRDEFHSEKEHIALLDKYCNVLRRSKENRLSGVVVACYLDSQGADFYQKSNRGQSPLDYISNEALKEKLQIFLQSRCLICEVNEATVELQPCSHAVCEDCNKIKLKRCPKCKTCINRQGFETLKSVNKEVQAVVPTFESKSLQVGSPILKEKDLLRVAQKLGNKWWQVGVFLGVQTSEQKIDDDSNDTVKHGFLMLYEWFKNCDPVTRNFETLRRALEESQCIAGLEYLSLELK